MRSQTLAITKKNTSALQPHRRLQELQGIQNLGHLLVSTLAITSETKLSWWASQKPGACEKIMASRCFGVRGRNYHDMVCP